MATGSRTGGTKKVEVRPLTPDRWGDLERLFGPRGACGGCWCMWWRLTRSEFEKRKGAQNKRAMKRIVVSGEVPGLLAYADGEPVGWCAIGPRASYPVLQRSRVLKPVDDQPVWSITCFFVARPYRGQGVSAALVKAAVAHARKNGARTIEGYPVEPKAGRIPDAFAYVGVPSTFRRAGFVEVLRRSPTRPIMRCVVEEKRRAGR
jgi:GNAT superfamily N-acetyltransferase